jgi:hypothetical protein
MSILGNLPACEHPEMRTVRRTIGANVHVWVQCQGCGTGRAIPKAGHDLDALPWWDEGIRDRWSDQRALPLHEIQRIRGEQSAEWWAKYSAYLNSTKWQALRDLVIQRDGGVCQACLSRPAEHVHHVTYELYNLLGASAAFECVAICRRCHEKIHPRLSSAQDRAA